MSLRQSEQEKMAEKATLIEINEHFEAIFKVAMTTQIVFQQPASESRAPAETGDTKNECTKKA